MLNPRYIRPITDVIKPPSERKLETEAHKKRVTQSAVRNLRATKSFGKRGVRKEISK